MANITNMGQVVRTTWTVQKSDCKQVSGRTRSNE